MGVGVVKAMLALLDREADTVRDAAFDMLDDLEALVVLERERDGVRDADSEPVSDVEAVAVLDPLRVADVDRDAVTDCVAAAVVVADKVPVPPVVAVTAATTHHPSNSSRSALPMPECAGWSQQQKSCPLSSLSSSFRVCRERSDSIRETPRLRSVHCGVAQLYEPALWACLYTSGGLGSADATVPSHTAAIKPHTTAL